MNKCLPLILFDSLFDFYEFRTIKFDSLLDFLFYFCYLVSSYLRSVESRLLGTQNSLRETDRSESNL